ncbi:uncharacterized protein LOC34619495 [Cyclospora cayetanensis]|uniref:Uncharacterized protein LOC34619495 n=1 Tax=Cyclospora cayetanensis TaxID=88456 RepID=A0A6P6RRN8_9EIME|nr:uncharacterized protein LOC34619495 [Cyclospora cayetanensis]
MRWRHSLICPVQDISTEPEESEHMATPSAASSSKSVALPALDWCRKRLSQMTTYSSLCRSPQLAWLFKAAQESEEKNLRRFFAYEGVKMRRSVSPVSGLANVDILDDPNTPAHAAQYIYGSLCRSPLVAACLRLEEAFGAIPSERTAEAASVEEVDRLITNATQGPPTQEKKLDEAPETIETEETITQQPFTEDRTGPNETYQASAGEAAWHEPAEVGGEEQAP